MMILVTEAKLKQVIKETIIANESSLSNGFDYYCQDVDKTLDNMIFHIVNRILNEGMK